MTLSEIASKLRQLADEIDPLIPAPVQPPIHQIPPSNPQPPSRPNPSTSVTTLKHRDNFHVLFSENPLYAHRYLYAAVRWNQVDQAWIDSYTRNRGHPIFRNEFDSGHYVPIEVLMRINQMARLAETE